MTEERKVSLVTAVSLLAAVLFGFFTFAAQRYIESAAADHRAFVVADDELRARVIRLEATYSEILKRLDRFDTKLDRYLESHEAKAR